MLNKVDILGVGITGVDKENILEEVFALLKSSKKFTIVTPNPEILVYAKKHKPYQTILNSATVSLPDGVGVLMAAKVLGKPLKNRITGVDFIENVCSASREKPVSMGFLGGGPEIAEEAVKCLKEKYPWIEVAFVGQEWSAAGFMQSQVKSHQVIKLSSHNTETLGHRIERLEDFRLEDLKANAATIDILFVAFGAPKQEEWIAKNLDRLPITGAMGVGGSFDYLSGRVMRAPGFIRAIGLEWLFRLIMQPWRWRRQLALLSFLWLVLQEKLRKSQG